ncbi:MAG TPA: ABC transporter ATP-binding protein [Myxococcales bacterium]|nr:ABC transporter ATP-binding protein [Myxococcales bacterium]
MAADALLRVTGLSRSFGAVRAVNGVGFELRQGGALGVIGPNGSGKSTLINLITGFVKPDAGRVELRGRDITGIAPHRAVNLGIARSFQMARPFYDLPVYKNVVLAVYSPRSRRRLGAEFGDRDEAALNLLEEVGFERDSQVLYKKAGELPHGYLKRLELARCLAVDPDLLILDELFSGMSLSEIASIVPLLERIRAAGKTLLMVEHRLRELFRVVDSVLVLHFGRKIAEGPPGEVMASKEVGEAYLGAEIRA